MDEVLRQVVGVFAEEVREQAQRIAAALLAMEASPAEIPGQIEELFRQAHSLKGSASSLGVDDLEALAHQLESALAGVRRSQSALTLELVDAALRAMDAAKLRADGLLADSDEGKREVLEATETLQKLTIDPPAPSAELPTAAVDLSASKSVGANEDANGNGNVNANANGNASANANESANVNTLPTVDPDSETVRVAGIHLLALERRLDELRAVRGRLDHRAAAVSAALQTLDRLWRDARAEAQRLAKSSQSSVVAPDSLYQLLQQFGALRRGLLDDAELAQANAVDLDENLRAMRMVPASYLLQPLQRAVREASRRTQKDAQVQLTGSEVQIDRRLLEELKNPLLHVVRNAVDHGLEAASVREAIGKPPRAVISVSIEQRGRDLVLEVRDDGRGIDTVEVRRKAVERALIDEAQAASMEEREVHDLLFRPGFSTAEQVTELSGRGVGLDVVRDAIIRLHGAIEVRSQIGRGTTFVLSVPLTVAASETMLIEEGGRPFAIPLSNIERIVRAPLSDLRPVGGRTFYHLDDQPIAVVRLSRLLGLTERHEGSAYRTLAVVRGAAERAAVVCERLLGGRDLVLRPLPPELQNQKLLGSAAILPNGQAVFILSPRALVDAAAEARAPVTERPSGDPGTILVADDSITTRSLLRNALEASGFRVRVAADGDEALRLALSEPFDLVVSDVRMPRLDGFGLTARLRSDARTRRLPVVLFSSLDSDEDRRRGSASGANAYLTKGAFDRGHLLDVVTGLIRGGG